LIGQHAEEFPSSVPERGLAQCLKLTAGSLRADGLRVLAVAVRLRGAPRHIFAAVGAVDVGQGLAGPPVEDRLRRVPDHSLDGEWAARSLR
jgi:hypothetical protein